MEEAIKTSNQKINNNLSYYEQKTRLSASEKTMCSIQKPNSRDRNFRTYTLKNSKENIDYQLIKLNDESIIHSTVGDINPSSINQESVNSEDSNNLIKNIFRGRKFISTGENWISNEIIKGKIVSSDNESVYIDCLIDVNTMYFEHRQFHRSLFENFKSLESGNLVVIKIKSKPGSFRFDVYPGEGLVDKKLFEISNDIQSLKGRDLGAKLGEW